MPAAASVMALSGCIGGSLRKRLSAVRNELEQGDSEAARHAYAEYVKYLREAKPIYQSIASPVIVFHVLWVGVFVSIEMYNLAGADKYKTIEVRLWGLLGIVIFLWVAAPPTWLPMEHAAIQLLAAQVASAAADRDTDADALLATMNAVGGQAGLKILHTPLTRFNLMKATSYVSIVVSMLRTL